ncbi:MAG: hypothetical protein H7A34_03095 [bacterium]|nr:hypothetical protein [bacterium]
MLNYEWPGNIRELKNVIKTSLVMCEGTNITLEDLPENLTKNIRSSFAYKAKEGSLDELEEQYIVRILRENNWKKSKTAEILKISRPTLDAKIKHYGIQIEK